MISLKIALIAGLLLGGYDEGQKRPDLIIADFEGPNYGAWTTTGEAFGAKPARGTLPGQMQVGAFEGEGLVNSFFEGDKTVGTLSSPEFTVERKYINFLVGGGSHPGETGVRLVVEGQVVVETTGVDSEFLRERNWHTDPFQGKKAKIVIFDHHRGGWGHINVDHIVQSDQTHSLQSDGARILKEAERSVKTKAATLKNDLQRPIYHVQPTAFWNNDPNGLIYYKGYYHLFYQFNPYGDQWGNMHWGHARSKDLAHWEHLPIALWPSKYRGEEHVFSGCATITPKGDLMLLYTSIGNRLPEQWAAIPEDANDPQLAKWKKHPANPIMTETLHGSSKIHEWRDPYVFPANNGKRYCVLGGNLNENKGGQGVVGVYEAENPDLTKWKYQGVLFQHPDKDVKNIECPIFFPLNDKWVLIVSQGKPVQYFVGELDEKTMKFQAETRGIMDHGSYYAPNVLIEDSQNKNRRLLWGWITDFPAGLGWNGAMTLPRVLTIGPDNKIRQQPAPELNQLRGPVHEISSRSIKPGEPLRLAQAASDTVEIELEFALKEAKQAVLTVRQGAKGGIPIKYDGKTLQVGPKSMPLALNENESTLKMRIFLDRSIIEVYANDRECLTLAGLTDPKNTGVEFASEGGESHLHSLRSWTMNSIWSQPQN